MALVVLTLCPTADARWWRRRRRHHDDGDVTTTTSKGEALWTYRDEGRDK